jgi:hypothetical protein
MTSHALSVHGSSYDAAAQTLTVTYANGRRYAYAGVPASVADALSDAEDQAEYQRLYIAGQYPVERVL